MKGAKRLSFVCDIHCRKQKSIINCCYGCDGGSLDELYGVSVKGNKVIDASMLSEKQIKVVKMIIEAFE